MKIFRLSLIAAAGLAVSACSAPEPAVVEEAAVEAETPVSAPPEQVASWTARGNEPGWLLTLDAGAMTLLYAYGEKTHTAPMPAEEAIEGGRKYVEGPGGLAVTALAKVCVDSMTGLPYPDTVTVALGDEVFSGCGGDPQSLLAGEAWRVETVYGERLSEGSSITMSFDTAGGRVSGKSGCNSYGAQYTLSGEGLTFSPPVSTEMACSEPLMTQESAFLKALAGMTMFAVDETGALQLDGPNGERITARR